MPDAPAATVLVVDDDRATRAMVRAVLARERYRILEAGDGHEAIAAVQTERPDLILMDVMMPGWTAMRRARKSGCCWPTTRCPSSC